MPISYATRFAALTAILVFLFVACKKHSSGSSLRSLGPDVYVAGSVNGRAVYWNNGLIHYLTDTSIQQWTYAHQIAFSGNDMYICGSQEIFSANIITPIYWKNGVMYNFPGEPQGEATGVAVSGNDVYVSGDLYPNLPDYAYAVYWKNGVIDSLSPDTSGVGQIITSGSDIYAAGEQTVNGFYHATFWKNGIPTELPTTNPASAFAIGFSGSDLYLAGMISAGVKDTAVYWKNGVETIVGPCWSLSGMSIANGDVYLAGSISVDTFNTAGIVWKNGNILMQLPNGSMIYGIWVSGSDIYLTGVQGWPVYPALHAVIWENGIAIDLGANNFAYSVIVK